MVESFLEVFLQGVFELLPPDVDEALQQVDYHVILA